jgi:hypothetical protein
LLLAALIAAPAPAGSPVRLSPVLPEVNRHLQEGEADVQQNIFPMACAHARLVLLDPEIKVAVLFQGVPPAEHDKCLRLLDSATAEWEKDLEGDVHFVRVPEGQTSTVVVRFRPSVLMKSEPVAGYVNWKRAIDSKPDGTVSSHFTADLQIRVRNLDGSPMPYNAMRHATMHEFGHVLGLDDSPHEGDVMGPLDIDHPVAAPTALEIQTVRSIRAEAEDILQKASAQATGSAG